MYQVCNTLVIVAFFTCRSTKLVPSKYRLTNFDDTTNILESHSITLYIDFDALILQITTLSIHE